MATNKKNRNYKQRFHFFVEYQNTIIESQHRYQRQISLIILREIDEKNQLEINWLNNRKEG